MNKIAFFDVDGTILDKDKNLRESTIEAFKAIRAAGNYCMLCTGRNLPQAQELDVLDTDGSILLNGSYITLNGKVLTNKCLDKKIAADLLEYAAEIGAGVHVLTLENVYSDDNWNRQKIDFLKAGFNLSKESFEKRARPDTPLDLMINEDIYKVDVRFPDPETRRKYYENLDDSLNKFIDSGYYSQGGTYYAELNRRDASKGTAVEMILETLGIPKENAYGFGDSNNDVPMLEACGHKIVVASGAPHIKEMADLVTEAPEDDGIYNAVIKLGLDK